MSMKAVAKSASVSQAIMSIVVLALNDSLQQHGAFFMAMFRGVQEAASKEGISTFISSATDVVMLPEWIDHMNPNVMLLIGTTSQPGIAPLLGLLPAVWITAHAEKGV